MGIEIIMKRFFLMYSQITRYFLYPLIEIVLFICFAWSVNSNEGYAERLCFIERLGTYYLDIRPYFRARTLSHCN